MDRPLMERLRLTVNETKTRICRLPEESFDFLGSTIGRIYSKRTCRAYVGPKPSRKKLNALCGEISAITNRRTTWKEEEEVVGTLNSKPRGWANYFRLGTVVEAYETVMHHARRRLRRWLCKKHKVGRREYARYSNEHLHGQYGLILLPQCTQGLPCAKSMNSLVREPGAGEPHARFDEREVETEHGWTERRARAEGVRSVVCQVGRHTGARPGNPPQGWHVDRHRAQPHQTPWPLQKDAGPFLSEEPYQRSPGRFVVFLVA